MTKLRGYLNYDTDEASIESGFSCTGPSMTDPSFAEEVDINTIVKRFGLTGEMPQQVDIPTYADFTSVVDYHTAMLMLKRADSEFLSLPGDVRARFNHDAGNLVSFLEDSKNRPEAERLGLVVKAQVQEPKAPAGGSEAEPPK